MATRFDMAGIANALDAFIAETARHRAFAAPPSAVMVLEPKGASLIREGGAPRSMPGRPHEAVRAILAERGGGLPQETGIRFARGLAILTEMRLPAESPDILSAIVRNKVESIAPWPLAQSAYGHRVRPLADDPAHVAVDVAVVSRALLEEVAGVLAAHGAKVTFVSVGEAGEDGLRIDYGAEEDRREAGKRARRLAARGAALLACVGAFGLALALHAQSQLSWYGTEADRLRASVQGAGEGVSLAGAANALAAKRRERPSAVSVLNDLSELVPQGVWLERLSLDGDRLELKGQGTGIPALIEILEAAPGLGEVNFASATELNAAQNADAFTIGATLQPATGEEAAQ